MANFGVGASDPSGNPYLTKFCGSYSSTMAYVTGDMVLGSDGNLYRAVASTAGNNPTTNAGAHWELFYVTTNTTLAVVTSGGRFNGATGLLAAVAFAEHAIIRQGATLTITVGNGTYSLGSAITLRSLYLRQWAITGNTGDLTQVVLSFTGTNGIAVSPGLYLGSLNGFTIYQSTLNSGRGIDLTFSGASIGSAISVQRFLHGLYLNGTDRTTAQGTYNTCSVGVYANANSSFTLLNAAQTNCSTGIQSVYLNRIAVLGTTNFGSTTTEVNRDGTTGTFASLKGALGAKGTFITD